MNRLGNALKNKITKIWHHHPREVLIFGGVIIVVVVAQFLYPSNRVLPFAKLDGANVGGKTRTAVAQMLVDTYSNVPVKVVAKGNAKTVTDTTTSAVIGIAPDVERTNRQLFAYPWWQRLLPLSIIVVGGSRDAGIAVEVDEKFDAYAKARLQACAVKAKNAAVIVKNGAVALDPAKSGQQCDKSQLKTAVTATHLSRKDTAITVTAREVLPERSDKDVKTLLKKAQSLAERTLNLSILGEDYPVNKATIASWLIFTADPKDAKKLTVDVDTNAMQSYIDEMQKKIYIAPSTTTIQTTDGIEISRSEGGEGRGLDHAATAEALKKQLLSGNGTAKATIATLPAKVVYQRAYSATKAGLQALLNDLVTDKGDYGISVRLLDGTVVSARGDAKYHPASTYKLFVAYSLLKRIASGEIKWSDSATAGKNVSQCFDVMIINSDNTCAEWFGGKIGWTTITNEVRALGLNSTNMGYGEKSSTADDETLFLMKLQNGTILGQAERDRLLDVMKRQVYRSGIPAGVGVTVADKVGFLDGLLHDSGIVYAPNKTYALTIMTNSSSWSQIADAAKQINAQLARM